MKVTEYSSADNKKTSVSSEDDFPSDQVKSEQCLKKNTSKIYFEYFDKKIFSLKEKIKSKFPPDVI